MSTDRKYIAFFLEKNFESLESSDMLHFQRGKILKISGLTNISDVEIIDATLYMFEII